MMNIAPLARLLALSSFLGCAAQPQVTAPPRPRPQDPVVSHEVSFTVSASRDRFVAAFLSAPLERFIKGTQALPGVARTEPLTAQPFPVVGSVRLVVLRDGNTAHEEVLACDQGQLRYLVTRYTSPEARPVDWGLGEFTFTPQGDITQVRWRYSFKLRRNTFPGWLGPLGRALFRSRFLERDYAPFMDAQVREIQAFAAAVPR